MQFQCTLEVCKASSFLGAHMQEATGKNMFTVANTEKEISHAIGHIGIQIYIMILKNYKKGSQGKKMKISSIIVAPCIEIVEYI